MQARIVHGLPGADYHAHPAISKSKLDLIARSPFHFHASHISDAPKPERDETNAMKMGTLAHCAILEPDEYARRYIVKPDDIDSRTARGKAWFSNVPPGMIAITDEQDRAAFNMNKALRALPDVAGALAKGNPEVSVFCVDDATGLELKCRPDWIREYGDDGAIILDVKTTGDASPRQFARSVANYRYHVQAAYYSDIYTKTTGRRVHAFVFAVCESAWPFAAACYQLDDAAMRKGRALYRQDLQLLKSCMDRNAWPAYGDAVQPLQLPEWALNF